MENKDKDYKKKWYQKNKKRLRRKAQTPEGKKYKSEHDKRYRESHREELLLKKREYTKNHGREKKEYDKKRREEHPEIKKNYYKNNKEKVLAGQKAIRSIKIPKGQLCMVCWKKLAIQRHHEHYYRPLEIIFCCRLCHEELDRNRRKREEFTKQATDTAWRAWQ